jgi:hypothetical protein
MLWLSGGGGRAESFHYICGCHLWRPGMVTTFLLLKFRRLRRVLRQTPVVVFVILAAFAAGTVWILSRQFVLAPNRYVVWAVATVVLLSAHRGRRDADFCRFLLPRAWRLFAVEYLLCFSPLVILSIVTLTWDNAIFYLLVPVFVAVMPTRRSSAVGRFGVFGGRLGLGRFSDFSLLRFLGVRSLELVSFVRRRSLLLVMVAVAAVVLSYVPVLSMLMLLAMTLILSGAYLENEPLDMLLLSEIGAGKYLKNKVMAGWILLMKLSAPTLLAYVVFNSETAYLALVPPVISLAGVALFVFAKYSRYSPDNKKVTLPMSAGLGMAGIIIPPMLPLTLLMPWWYFHAAKENLDNYLYVYDY